MAVVPRAGRRRSRPAGPRAFGVARPSPRIVRGRLRHRPALGDVVDAALDRRARRRRRRTRRAGARSGRSARRRSPQLRNASRGSARVRPVLVLAALVGGSSPIATRIASFGIPERGAGGDRVAEGGDERSARNRRTPIRVRWPSTRSPPQPGARRGPSSDGRVGRNLQGGHGTPFKSTATGRRLDEDRTNREGHLELRDEQEARARGDDLRGRDDVHRPDDRLDRGPRASEGPRASASPASSGSSTATSSRSPPCSPFGGRIADIPVTSGWS